MNAKKESRLRRARRARAKIRELGVYRLSVNRTPRHIYAQIISPDGGQVLASASTLDSSLREGGTGNADAAAKVGALIAERAKQAGITDLTGAKAAGYHSGGNMVNECNACKCVSK